MTIIWLSDFSFETQDSKLGTINEDEMLDDISEIAKEETEEEQSIYSQKDDFNEQDASFIYDNMANVLEHQDDDNDMPDMDVHRNDDSNVYTKAREGTSTQKRNQTAAAGETNFYNFFIFMMLRHMFGSFLLKGVKKASYWEKFLLLKSKQEDDDQSSKEESRRTMKLRQLKLDEGNCEVYPPLSDIPTIPEDEILL